MRKIQLLSKDAIDKIAAGEVVVNGASVLKELLENSIDANSTAITINIMNGGKTQIKVVDNGDGIFKEDIAYAFLRNATSKLSLSLDNIATLGFRGEALASISYAADVSVITRTKEDEIGTLARILKSEVVSENEIVSNQGTTIEVNNLFQNIPARYKYLKKDKIETEEIIDVGMKTALAHPEISMHLICDGKEVFYTTGNTDPIQCMGSLLGAAAIEGLVHIDIDDAPLFVNGYLSSPSYIGEKKWRYIILNGRYIHSDTINRAIDQVYYEYHGKTGASFLLYINIPYHMVDVNIHPAKLEVKLLNESLVLMLIKQGIRDALKNQMKLKDIELPLKILANIPENYSVLMEDAADYSGEKMISPIENDDILSPMLDPSVEIFAQTHSIEAKQYDLSGTQSNRKESIINKELIAQLSAMSYIGNAFGLYALLETEDELYTIDTHAAHERVLYEKYLNAYRNKSVNRQQLMLPIILNMETKQKYILLQNIDIMSDFGFEIEEFDSQSIAIRSIPYYFNQNEIPLIIEKMSLQISDSFGTADFTRRNEKLIGIACHNAVRGKENLSEQEIRELLKDLSKTDMPYTCPHGRPIIGKINKKYFMRMFERI